MLRVVAEPPVSGDRRYRCRDDRRCTVGDAERPRLRVTRVTSEPAWWLGPSEITPSAPAHSWLAAWGVVGRHDAQRDGTRPRGRVQHEVPGPSVAHVRDHDISSHARHEPNVELPSRAPFVSEETLAVSGDDDSTRTRAPAWRPRIHTAASGTTRARAQRPNWETPPPTSTCASSLLPRGLLDPEPVPDHLEQRELLRLRPGGLDRARKQLIVQRRAVDFDSTHELRDRWHPPARCVPVDPRFVATCECERDERTRDVGRSLKLGALLQQGVDVGRLWHRPAPAPASLAPRLRVVCREATTGSAPTRGLRPQERAGMPRRTRATRCRMVVAGISPNANEGDDRVHRGDAEQTPGRQPVSMSASDPEAREQSQPEEQGRPPQRAVRGDGRGR